MDSNRTSTPLPEISENCFGGSMTGVQSKGILSSLRYTGHSIVLQLSSTSNIEASRRLLFGVAIDLVPSRAQAGDSVAIEIPLPS